MEVLLEYIRVFEHLLPLAKYKLPIKKTLNKIKFLFVNFERKTQICIIKAKIIIAFYVKTYFLRRNF